MHCNPDIELSDYRGKEADNAPIFIGGIARSGTTLLAAMLSSHSRLYCGPESQFFNALARVNTKKLTDPARWPIEALEFLGQLEKGGVRILEQYQLDRDTLQRELVARPPRVSSILETLINYRAVIAGKPRWIEKSPSNVMHLDAIRHFFPKSPIICIVRDPRDVVNSLVEARAKFPANFHWIAESRIANYWFWADRERRQRSFCDADPNCLIIRFEDLVTNPDGSLKIICDFIKEEFEPGMLDPGTSARNVVPSNEKWKGTVGKPIQATRVCAWKKDISEGEKLVADSICFDGIAHNDYELSSRPQRKLVLFPQSYKLCWPSQACVERLAKSGFRIEAISRLDELSLIEKTATVVLVRRNYSAFLASPFWFGCNLLRIALIIVKLKWRGVKIWSVSAEPEQSTVGWRVRLTNSLFSRLGHRIKSDLSSVAAGGAQTR